MLNSNLRLFAGAAATALAFSSAAMAQGVQSGALNGAYSADNWSLTKEGPGAVKDPQPTVAADVKAAADAALAQKQLISTQLLNAISTATTDAITAYEASVAAQKLAATQAATAVKTLAAAEAAKAEADALLVKLTAAKATATTKVTETSTALTAAIAAKTALVNPTAAQLTAADAAIAKAQVAADLATAAAAPITAAYNAAVADAAAAVTNRSNALAAKGVADAAVLTTNADVAAKSTLLTTALAADEDFAATLAAVNGAAGTNFAATYEGIQAIEAYGADPLPVRYASNGYARATAALTAAAASKNQYISMASGALTGSAAALEAGANFETEVLGALVDHEGRIAGNSAAIAKEAVDRAAEDKRIVGLIDAETSARIAGDLELRDRIASSTATAIAMGGAVILPDTNFTISGNVGIYEGAQAIAINASARVSEKAYVTGAFGGGLNKRGTVGGRVGVVFGF